MLHEMEKVAMTEREDNHILNTELSRIKKINIMVSEVSVIEKWLKVLEI